MLTKSKKHSDTSPVCQRHRIAVLSCFILPGLPSQALARQLSQRESPWQRGFVFDETDLRLLENVTGCQSLSLWERCLRSRRRGQGCCQRARHTAIRTLLVRAIVSLCFRVLFCRACPLRRWRASSPKGRALGKEVSFSMKPTGAYWKTSRNAKASPARRGGIERSRDGEGKDADKKQKNTAIQALFVRDIVSLCFRVLFGGACALRRWRASSPKGRALGKEVRLWCTPPCRGRQADSTPSG